MRDPYEALGVTRDASLAQIKKAYKNLAKKATTLPDAQAEARMNELNNAYDYIMNHRSDTVYGGAQRAESFSDAGETGSYRYYGDNAYTAANYGDVRNLINENRYDDAQMILDGVPADRRNAEWHYLKGRILYNKGWLEDASREFEAAYRAEPSNGEYRSAYENLFSKRTGGYRHTAGGRRSRADGCDACDLCSGLLCADCCCESMGGDLIPCC